MNDKGEELKTKAEKHVKEIFDHVEKIRPMIEMFGLEYGVSPDQTAFYIRAKTDNPSVLKRNLMLRGAADAFSFNIEFGMVGDVKKSPACPVAVGMFLDVMLKMVLNAVKDAITANAAMEKEMGSAFSDDDDD